MKKRFTILIILFAVIFTLIPVSSGVTADDLLPAILPVPSPVETVAIPESAPIPAAKYTVSKIAVNGKDLPFETYNINSHNYFKLRDLAYVLNGTEKQFEVAWNSEKNVINLTGGKAYTEVGGEMTGNDASDASPAPANSKIYIDGKEISFTAYNIGGNNYFRLCDIGQAFNFGIGWDLTKQILSIDTNKGYPSVYANDGTVQNYMSALYLINDMDAAFPEDISLTNWLAYSYPLAPDFLFIESRLIDYVGEEKFKEWTHAEAENGTYLYVNVLTYIEHFNLTKDQFIEACNVYPQIPLFGDDLYEVADVLFSGDIEKILRYTKVDGAVYSNEKIFSVEWLNEHTMQDYITNGIDFKDLEKCKEAILSTMKICNIDAGRFLENIFYTGK